ncbi:MAG: TlpA disulfide reductase family protein [Verrucomicrobiota bacterium]
MKNKVSGLLLGLVGVLVQSAVADEKLATLRVGSATYTNVTVTSVTATDIYFTHAQGMGNAKLKELGAESQKKFGYNPIKGSAVEKQQAEANAKFRTAVAVQAREQKTAATKTVAAPENNGNEPVAPKLHAKSLRGSPAPHFVVEQWITPKPAMAGKFVLVDFWATWCPPCRGSIPHLNGLQAKFKDNLVVVGLSDESEADIRSMASPKIDYAVASDTAARALREVQVTGIPHAILIDPKGIVRFEGMPHYLTEKGLQLLIDRYGD